MLHFARWKTITILVVCALGVLYAAPNLFSEKTLGAMPSWLPHKQVHLGLDLQGGSHLLLEMNTQELMDDWLKAVKDDVRQRLRKKKIGYTNLRAGKDQVQVRIRKPEQFEAGFKALKGIAQQSQGSLFMGTGGFDLEVTKATGNVVTLKPTRPAVTERVSSALGASIETIRRRVDQLGTTEPNIQRQGRARILVQVPGFDDPERLKRVIGSTAKLTFQAVHPTISPSEAHQTRPPVGYAIYPPLRSDDTEYVLKQRPVVTGEELVDAQPSFDRRTNEPVVVFRFNSSGARKFGRFTQANVGRPFAIVLDGKVISAPRIIEAILGGSGQITGNFTVESANDLAVLLRAGALPASLTIIEERTVGPSLGADSVAAGEIAGIIGLLAVIAFMIMAYGLFGIFSTLALTINIALLLGILSALQATLTLPGIAGIVLTVGMAVDANVLIFERIREEVRAGKSAINAIDTGYSRALGTILDANITTFIAAFILFWLGSGPIRGFAVTLSIGIFTSVFTAFTVSRLFISWWIRGQKRHAVVVPI